MMDELLETDVLENDTQHGKFLTFLLGEEAFGIEIEQVTEIVGMQKVNNLPEAPEYIKGIINLRGRIIPVIDMRVRFKKEPVAYTDRTCIIVIEIFEMTIGLIVDRVEEVVNIPDSSIVPPPDFRTGFQNKYIKGIGKIGENIRLILDCEKLFKEAELGTLQNMLD